MDGILIAEQLAAKGYEIKTKSRTNIVVLVSGNRLEKMQKLAEYFAPFGGKIDPHLSKSSIGGIVVGNVKIILKPLGKTSGLDVESAAIDALDKAIESAKIIAGGPINVKLNTKIVKNVVGVRKTTGTPKSDFHLVDDRGDAVAHISHKKGSSPKDFQQWGGVTEAKIASHPEVIAFEKEINELYPGGRIPNGESAFMKIKSLKLKRMSVYGVNYDSPGTDVNRVDVLMQGVPDLKKISKKLYSLTASGNVHYLNDPLSGGYNPVLAVIYKGDRSQMGLKGARVSIYPMGGRTFKREIKNDT
jgi:hypothetical protein